MPAKKKAFFVGDSWFADHYQIEINGMIDLAIDRKVQHFFTGLNLGFDQTVATALVKRRLPWSAVLDFPGIEKNWKPRQQSRFKKLLAVSRNTTVVYPEPFKMKDWRKPSIKEMIRKSHVCVAVTSGSYWDEINKTDRGGPEDIVALAAAKNLEIIQYTPSERLVLINPPSQQLQLQLF